MDGYNTIGSESPFPETPLFGQTSLWDKISGWINVGIAAVFIMITMLCALIKPQSDGRSKGTNIYFSFCLLFLGMTHWVLVYWYKQGDVDPKFRYLKYANTIIMVMLCVCALLYIFDD